MSLLPATITRYTTQSKICTVTDHCHKDPHIDLLTFDLAGRRVAIESERWSLFYTLYINDQYTAQGDDITIQKHIRDLLNENTTPN